MFGFGKKKVPAMPTQKPVNEELLKKEIFSAKDAQEMGVESKNKKRNDNRMNIFRSIKAAITTGYSTVRINDYLLDDGNDIYFEGLGFKLKKVWMDSQTGQMYDEKPVESANPIEAQQIQGQQYGGGGWGTSGSGNRVIFAQPYMQPFYQPYINISWE